MNVDIQVDMNIVECRTCKRWFMHRILNTPAYISCTRAVTRHFHMLSRDTKSFTSRKVFTS
jgi:hypothetical protein